MTLIIKSQTLICPTCGKTSKKAMLGGKRRIIREGGEVYVRFQAYRCLGDEQHLWWTNNKETDKWSPYSNRLISYGLFFRCSLNLSYERAAKAVSDIFKTKISREKLRKESYVLGSILKEETIKQINNECIKQKYALICIDGQDGLKGLEQRWIVVEGTTGYVLNEKILTDTRAEILAEFISDIREELDVKKIFIVSDAGSNIIKAIEKYHSDIPHQLCQFHFIKHGFEPIIKADSQFKKNLSQELRGNRIPTYIKSWLSKSSKKEINIAENIHKTFRLGFKTSHDYPIRLWGVEIFKKLQHHLEAMKPLMNKYRKGVIRGIYNKYKKIMSQFQPDFHEIKRAHDRTLSLIKTLSNSDGSSKQVREDFLKKLKHIEYLARSSGSQLEQRVCNRFRGLLKIYDPKIFTFYDFNLNIRTNNICESRIKSDNVKVRQRTGLKTVTRFLSYHGGTICYENGDLSSDQIFTLRSSKLAEERALILKSECELRRSRSIRANTKVEIQNLWLANFNI